MQNKNYYREFNKPIHKSNDDKFLNIFIFVVLLASSLLASSLLAYGFWDAIFQWI